MIKDFLRGFFIIGTAHRVIVKYKYWPFLIIPGIMSFCFITLLIVLAVLYFPGFSTYMNENWIPEFMSGKIMFAIMVAVMWIVMFFVGYMTYKPVILTLLSPLLGQLSERTERDVYNRPGPPFSMQQVMKDVVRGIIINMRNLALTILFMLLAWLFVFIPLVGPLISMVCMIAIQSYYGGYSLVDYTLERKQYSVKDSIQFAKGHRALVTGVGAAFMLLALVPVVGWFSAPTYGTVAATLASLEKMEDAVPEYP